MHEEIDISGWVAGGVEHLGTKPKAWVEDPAGQLWLYKAATTNRRPDGTAYLKGDDWSERVASAVALELGLPVATVELAVTTDGSGRRRQGVISKRFVNDDESLVLGNLLLEESGAAIGSGRDRPSYTLAAVRRALVGVRAPMSGRGLTAWEWWVGYVVLDALVGNTDRHEENWAAIDGLERRLAPSFDHASSLGFQLDDDDRSARLVTDDRYRSPRGYAARARSKFAGRAHPVAVAREGLALVSPAAKTWWIDQVRQLPDLEELFDEVPTHRASEAARSFACAVFAANRERLLSQGLSTLSP